MNDSTALQAIFDRIEAGEDLSEQELQMLIAAVRGQEITIATGNRAVAIGGNAEDTMVITGDRNVIIADTDVEAIQALMGKRPRSESILLQAVEDEVSARLNQSLYDAISIQLNLEAQPEQVRRLWDFDIKIGDQPIKPIPEGWNSLQVFEEIKGKLLILGNPGAGKTTTMLELAQKLVVFSKRDAEYPIPVLFNLSTWRDNKQSIQNWLVLELKLKYGVREDVARKWVSDAKLLPMLDGLDELESIRQEPCIQAINHFLNSDCRPQYIVVCSRWEEYSLHSCKLELNGATFIKELTYDKIQNYLVTVGQRELYQELQQDLNLLELLKTPLFLNIVVLSEEELSVEEWRNWKTLDERRNYLITAYIQRMLKRRLNSKAYSSKEKIPNPEKIRQQLTWLAQQLQRNFLTEFLIEKIQPSWLQTYPQKIFYSVPISLVSWLYIFLWIALFTPLQIADGIGIGLSGGLLFGLVDATTSLKGETIKLVETINFSIINFISKFTFALISAVLARLFEDSTYMNAPIKSAISSLGAEIELKLTPNQGIFKSLKNLIQSILFLLLYFLLAILSLALISLEDSAFPILLLIVLIILPKVIFRIFIFSISSVSCFKHFSIRIILYFSGYASWNYALFLDHCTERLLLQRVGGRYRFIHRLLQEHFAAMPLEKVRGDR